VCRIVSIINNVCHGEADIKLKITSTKFQIMFKQTGYTLDLVFDYFCSVFVVDFHRTKELIDENSGYEKFYRAGL